MKAEALNIKKEEKGEENSIFSSLTGKPDTRQTNSKEQNTEK